MSAASSSLQRGRLASSAAATALGLLLLAASWQNRTALAAGHAGDSRQRTSTPGSNDIRPFRVAVPDAALVDLRRRIAATRWPDRETVTDRSQGVQLARLQELVRYWGSGYDWRRVEAKLNAWPQFTTRIDGLDVHFIHVRSRHANALPVIITHGWPGSVIELLEVIGDAAPRARPRRGPPRSRCRWPSPCFPRTSIDPRRPGPGAPIAT